MGSPRMHDEIDAQARAMATEGHSAFLAAAITGLRARDGDPVIETLRLLRAMWGTSLASRPLQQVALNDVGVWLERRLRREPMIPAAALLEEATWIRRLAKYYVFAGPRASVSGPPSRPQFGERIDDLERRRHAAPAERPRDLVAGKVSSPAVPLAPTSMPDEFEVVLEDLVQAREALRKWKERTKRGKPPRDRALPVKPVLKALSSLSVGLYVSFESTAGLVGAFEHYASKGGGGPFILTVVARSGDAITKVLFLQSSTP